MHFTMLVRKFSSQGGIGGGPKMKKMQKNCLFTIIFIFYLNELKNLKRSLKYIFLKSSVDTFCDLGFEFQEYTQKRVKAAIKKWKNAK